MTPGGRRGVALAASALLHGAALAAMLWAARLPPEPLAEQGVTLVWDSTEPGASDAEDSAGAPAPPPTVAPPQAPPPAPELAAAPPPAPPPPQATAPPPPPAPQEAPAPPALPGQLALPPPPAPPSPAPPAEPQPVAAADPPPPPAPRPQPRQAAAPPPQRSVWSPPSRQAPPGEGTPMAAAGAAATGAVVPPRPSGGASNPSPDYPVPSRRRGEQGRVTLLVQVEPNGRVRDLAVVGSSGYPALDTEAERTVRRWRFEPGTQDGSPVFSTVTVGITFRLEGERRW